MTDQAAEPQVTETTYTQEQLNAYGSERHAEGYETGLAEGKAYFQAKIREFEKDNEIVDMKYRAGKWWMRLVKTLRPRNHPLGGSQFNEVESESFEACIDRLAQ